MNTTYFLNCAAGNIFNTKTSPALPKTSTPRSVETATIMTIKEGYLSLSAQNPT